MKRPNQDLRSKTVWLRIIFRLCLSHFVPLHLVLWFPYFHHDATWYLPSTHLIFFSFRSLDTVELAELSAKLCLDAINLPICGTVKATLLSFNIASTASGAAIPLFLLPSA